MPSRKEELLLNAFAAVANERWRGLGSIDEAAAVGLTAPEEGGDLRKDSPAVAAGSRLRTELLGSYSELVQSSPVYRAAAEENAGGAASKAASAIFRNALGMVPLARAIFSLFGGGEPEREQPLVKYALPAPFHFETANVGDAIAGVDYGQDGLPRAVESPGGKAAVRDTAEGDEPRVTETRDFPQITIQVQAMDSRSFLDHKEDIARAVREAMLNMHPLNDVVSEL